MKECTLQASITVQSSVTVKYRYSEKCGPGGKDTCKKMNPKEKERGVKVFCTLFPDVLLPLKLCLLQRSFEHYKHEKH